MLGCQDFCGYYDWTFAHLRRTFGQAAVHALWAEAIGGESQRHYLDAARADGLRGLLRTWDKTGEDEHCDWTFTLDEQKNVLRWDMRRCPSKGFLIGHELNADEDYCDHCIGWIAPLLAEAGVEVAAHEHNHCGQCWAEMRVKGKPYASLAGHATDIHNDPRWQSGYLDRWAEGARQPATPETGAASDPAEVLAAWFARADEVTVLGRGPSAAGAADVPREHVIVTGVTYATGDVFAGDPLAVLIGDGPEPALLDAIAARFNATPPERRPLLMYAYLPGDLRDAPAFARHGLPRPAPILPLLIRAGLYRHAPGEPYPTTGVFAVLVAAALGKRVRAAL